MKITDIKGTVPLHNGIKMPYLGLGVFQSQNGAEVINAVSHALKIGYRSIDTASFYDNEEGVGEGIRKSDIPRPEVFVTTKVWNSDQGYDSTISAFKASLARLGLDYLDLYLIHWPVKGKYKQTWRALETLYQDGLVKSIGVSNFLRHQLDDLLQTADIKPMVNQMEFHPRLVQQGLLDYCQSNDIVYEAWSPLMQGHIFAIEDLTRIASKHGKSIAQVTLRWNLQKGVVTIPKSSKPHRIEENGGLFDFELTADDMSIIDALDQGKRIGPDPDNFDF